MQIIVDDMCVGRYTNEHRNCTTKTMLSPDLWLVDTVLQKNVWAQSTETRLICVALYAVHSGYWFSTPVLIWDQMHKCREGLVAKRKKAAEIWSLPFLFLITQLLHAKWVAFLDEDFTITD